VPRLCLNLQFDAATSQAVSDLRERLTGKPQSLTYGPHITLAVYEVDDLSFYEARLAAIGASSTAFPVRFEALGIFPETGTVFLEPRPSLAVLELHRRVLQQMSGPGRPGVLDEFLLPDRWTPHCTLAGRLQRPDLLAILEKAMADWKPIRGQASRLSVRSFPALTDHCSFPMSDV
jgi:2'-5' RNA ligase